MTSRASKSHISTKSYLQPSEGCIHANTLSLSHTHAYTHTQVNTDTHTRGRPRQDRCKHRCRHFYRGSRDMGHTDRTLEGHIAPHTLRCVHRCTRTDVHTDMTELCEHVCTQVHIHTHTCAHECLPTGVRGPEDTQGEGTSGRETSQTWTSQGQVHSSPTLSQAPLAFFLPQTPASRVGWAAHMLPTPAAPGRK